MNARARRATWGGAQRAGATLSHARPPKAGPCGAPAPIPLGGAQGARGAAPYAAWSLSVRAVSVVVARANDALLLFWDSTAFSAVSVCERPRLQLPRRSTLCARPRRRRARGASSAARPAWLCPRTTDAAARRPVADAPPRPPSFRAARALPPHGAQDLESVTYVELTVDAETMPINEMGAMLPALRELKLNSSSIATLRELGTGLGGLRVLWISRCSVADLEGLAALPALRELYASFNDIADVSAVAELEELTTLDLEGNRVERDQLEWLGACASLRSLALDGNPVAAEVGYRHAVATTVPQLEYIDDEPVIDEDRLPPTPSSSTRQQLDAGEGAGADLPELRLRAGAASPVKSADNTPREGAGGAGMAVDEDEEELRRLEALEKQMVGFGIKYAKIGIDSVLTLGELAGGEGIREGDGLGAMRPRTACRPSTPGPRPTSDSALLLRPGTALSAGSGGYLSRPGTAGGFEWEHALSRTSLSAGAGSTGPSLLSRPGTSAGARSRPMSAFCGVSANVPPTLGPPPPVDPRDDEDDGKLETVLIGAPTRALRDRRRAAKQHAEGAPGGSGGGEHGGGDSEGGKGELAPLARGMDNSELLEQLCQWKLETQMIVDADAEVAGGLANSLGEDMANMDIGGGDTDSDVDFNDTGGANILRVEYSDHDSDSASDAPEPDVEPLPPSRFPPRTTAAGGGSATANTWVPTPPPFAPRVPVPPDGPAPGSGGISGISGSSVVRRPRRYR